jgi:hypothetical protein
MRLMAERKKLRVTIKGRNEYRKGEGQLINVERGGEVYNK